MYGRNAFIIAVVALLVGAGGLAVAISAKTGTKSDEEIAESVKGELASQVSSSSETAGAAKVQAARAAAAGRLLKAEVAALTAKVDRQSGRITAQGTTIQSLTEQLAALTSRVDTLEQKK
jgi:hypothetical protein